MTLTRFAPAPTGYLHLGHVANAVWVWGLAAKDGGQVLLRIEDHDRSRCRPEYDAALLEDLEWLGFRADLGAAPTERLGRTVHWPRWTDCGRTASSTAAIARGRPSADGPRSMDGRGRGRAARVGAGSETPKRQRCGSPSAVGPRRGRTGSPGRVSVRFRWPAIRSSATATASGRTGSPSSWTTSGTASTWSFAVVICSTPRRTRSGWGDCSDGTSPPGFAHHPLILRPDGSKLSKADGATSLRELRAAGRAAEDLIREAAVAVGWPPSD